MAIEIRTTRYEFSHGKAPRGKGSWAFIQEASHGHEEHLWFAPSNLTYREACAVIRKRVKASGFQDATLHAAP